MDVEFNPRTPKKSRASQSPIHPSLRSPHSTPSKSPAREVYGDRFIPMRAKAKLDFTDVESPACRVNNENAQNEQNANRENMLYQSLLRNELLGGSIGRVPNLGHVGAHHSMGSGATSAMSGHDNVLCTPPLIKYHSRKREPDELTNSFSLSPISANSQKLLRSPRKAVRKIPKSPFKVLDAPDLQDDFYLNLVDWSSSNVLSVGLGSCVYLWSAHTSQVTRLCDLAADGDTVNSVAWNEKGQYVAVGTSKGHVQIWDSVASKRVRT